MQRWHPLPPGVYALVDRTPGTVLLESARSGGAIAYSRLFLSATSILTATDGRSLEELFGQVESAVHRDQFVAGYFSYECGNAFEPKTGLRVTPAAYPLAWFGIYSQCHRFDHAAGAFVDGEPEEFAQWHSETPAVSAQAVDVRLGLEESEYSQRIAAIHELIRAGDVYQLNFTFPLRFGVKASAVDLYSTLRNRQPVEFGAFLHCDFGRRILSFSPELFFRIEEQGARRHIVTRPMKGTAPRGRTTAEDRAIAEWLRKDPKNCSENVMIVDLLRNDLGRLCEYGSVRVDELFQVERHPSLWQMTSTISGDLRSGLSFREIFRALFPSGSVTGAPKVRAMQLLAKLEEEPRGVYTGAIGYFSREQTMFNVAIRTIDLNGSEGRMGVGSGIVIDSVAAEEFRECALKAQFLTASPEPFFLIETMLWDEGYPLIELHLDRLEDSANYFGFVCDRNGIRASLVREAGAFGDSRRRVRLTLAADGTLHIEHEAQVLDSDQSSPLRVCISSERTDAADRFLFHKTINRAIYTETLKIARGAGYEDAVFINGEGQITEGAISNIFIEKDGRWFTPPIECGLLPGVYRRHLIETRRNISERILRPEDLKAADGVYLSNAVRGLRRVVIDWENAAATPQPATRMNG